MPTALHSVAGRVGVAAGTVVGVPLPSSSSTSGESCPLPLAPVVVGVAAVTVISLLVQPSEFRATHWYVVGPTWSGRRGACAVTATPTSDRRTVPLDSRKSCKVSGEGGREGGMY